VLLQAVYLLFGQVEVEAYHAVVSLRGRLKMQCTRRSAR
jgi:hypothetical protein